MNAVFDELGLSIHRRKLRQISEPNDDYEPPVWLKDVKNDVGYNNKTLTIYYTSNPFFYKPSSLSKSITFQSKNDFFTVGEVIDCVNDVLKLHCDNTHPFFEGFFQCGNSWVISWGS